MPRPAGELTSSNGGTYTSTNSLTFTAFDALIGGDQADSFAVTEGVSFSGSLDGVAGTDVLAMPGYVNPVSVTLTGVGPLDGFDGNATGLAQGFQDIDSLVGLPIANMTTPDGRKSPVHLQPGWHQLLFV